MIDFLTHHRIVLVGLAVAMFALLGCNGDNARAGLEKVRIGDRTFYLEVVDNDTSRTQGLMFRESISADGGMLFVFPEADVRSFWMGYCLVDMDIMFLDPRGFVTAIHEMKKETPQGEDESEFAYRARMADYGSGYPAQFAIELQAGMIRTLGIKRQDRIELDLDGLKARAK